MNVKKNLILGVAVSASSLLCLPFSFAQQKPLVPQANMAYDVTHESVVQGTVLSYTAASGVAPIGPHARVQTSSGVVDVHLGNASLLKQSDIFLAPGDSVSIVGATQTFASGPVLLARVLRKGSQTVTLRNFNGIPLVAKPAANARPRSIIGGAQ